MNHALCDGQKSFRFFFTLKRTKFIKKKKKNPPCWRIFRFCDKNVFFPCTCRENQSLRKKKNKRHLATRENYPMLDGARIFPSTRDSYTKTAGKHFWKNSVHYIFGIDTIVVRIILNRSRAYDVCSVYDSRRKQPPSQKK